MYYLIGIISFIVFSLLCLSTYILLIYDRDVPEIHILSHMFGTLQYTIKKVDTINDIHNKYFYKIYWNIFPVLQIIGINILFTDSKIPHISSSNHYIDNHFKSYNEAVRYIKSDRSGYKYKINIQHED